MKPVLYSNVLEWVTLLLTLKLISCSLFELFVNTCSASTIDVEEEIMPASRLNLTSSALMSSHMKLKSWSA